MKKIISLLLVCIMAIVTIAGCGNELGSTDDMQTLTVWSGGSHSKNFYMEKVNEFNKTIGKEIGIRVEYIIKNDVSKEIELAYVSGQAPDMMSGGKLNQLAGEGKIIAFEDIDGGKEFIEHYKDFVVPKKNMCNGKTYSVPFACTTNALVYNKDMFKAAGIVDENGEALPPKTWDDVIEIAKKLTNKDKKEYGIIFNAKDSTWFGDNVNQPSVSDGGFIDGYNPYTGVFEYDAQAQVMKKVMQIKEDGTYVPGAEGLNNDAARARFAAGKIGMKMAASFDYAVYTEQFPAEIDWGVAPYPVIDENNFCGQFCTFTGGWQINTNAIEKFGADKVLKVYDFFHNDEFMVDMYKAGVNIPYNYELIKDVELSDEMKNWGEFAKMLAISYNAPQYIVHETDITGMQSLAATWDEIWAGKIPVSDIDKVCADYAKACNDGKKKYIETHPDYVQPELVSSDYVIYDGEK